MIIPLSPWFMFMVFIVIVAIAVGFIENIISIATIVVMVGVMLFLLYKWPKKTIIGIALFLAISLSVMKISDAIKTNNTPVLIYEAVDDCVIFDEEDSVVQIPAGSIIARYTDTKLISVEENTYDMHSRICVWHYEGELHSSTVSIRHGMKRWINDYGFEENIWNLKEIKEITYKEYQNGDWWK